MFVLRSPWEDLGEFVLRSSRHMQGSFCVVLNVYDQVKEALSQVFLGNLHAVRYLVLNKTMMGTTVVLMREQDTQYCRCLDVR